MNRTVQIVLPLLVGIASANLAPAQSARQIVDTAGVRGGLLVHVGCGDGHLTAELQTLSGCLVHGLDADPQHVAEARDLLRSRGLYGRATVDEFNGRTLPYISDLVNVLVDSSEAGGVAPEEYRRVLSPRGVVVVRRSSLADRRFDPDRWQPLPIAGRVPAPGGTNSEDDWVAFRKLWPDELDQWTHWLHGPDNNAVSRDRKVGVSRHLQWIMPPRWSRHHNLLPSVSAMVSAGGRIYYIIDEGAISVRGLPDRWKLVARDAFNGLDLWKRPIDNWGWRTWSEVEFSGVMRFKAPAQLFRRLVAVDDVVYVTLGFDQPLVALDGATGQTIREYAGTENTSEILYDRGRLLLAKNAADRPGGKEILAVNADTGEILWHHGGYRGTSGRQDELKQYTDAYLTAGRDKVFFIDADDIVAVDRDSGREAWRAPRPEMEKNVLGHYQFNHANLCTLVLHDDILLLGQMYPFPDNLNARQQKAMVLVALDTATGQPLWQAPGMSLAHFTPPDLFVTDGLVWTLKMSEVSLLGLDVRTGEVKREYPVKDMLVGHHHRCYRNKATERFYLAGEEGIEYIDFQSGDLDVHHWMRGACAYGILPANGCIYLPTHSCGCHNNTKLNGFIALTAEPFPHDPTPPAKRLEKGPAYREVGTRKSEVGSGENHPGGPQLPTSDFALPTSADWPVFKHDNARSNFARTDLPDKLSQIWKTSIGGRPTPPVIAAGRVYVASQDTHELFCLDAATGKPVWQVTTTGSLDTPPTYHAGRVYLGTRAGYVCALNATDGRLAWRFQAAPADARLTAFGQLESVWPVNGSVLILNDRVYCVAGRSMHLNGGLHAYVLDAATGEILQQATWAADTEVKGELRGSILPDILVSDGKTIEMRTMQLSPDNIAELHTAAPAAQLTANDGGLLDDTWFNSAFWVYLKNQAQMLVFDDDAVYGIQAYNKFVTKSYPHDIFTPGQGYRLFAAKNTSEPATAVEKRGKRRGGQATSTRKWEQRIDLRGQAMAVTNRRLCLAGTPDVVDKKAPWAALDGDQGGVLRIFTKQDGEQTDEFELESPPVNDGIAPARERIYLCLQSGEVVCLGKP